MFYKSLLAGVAALAFAAPAFAEITVEDAYARAASPMSKTGAAFMVIHNEGGAVDRLVAVSSDAAARVELHTHQEDANGVMRMLHVEKGFELPADGEIVMKRGGKHVMLMGLTAPLEQGAAVSITLTFENAGDVVVEVPVDLERQDHGAMTHGNQGHMTHGSDS